MSTRKDDYQINYDYPSGSLPKSSGFLSFQNTESGEYFFRLNSPDGAPLLYSQGYAETKGRDNGIESVKKNSLKKGRYKTVEDDGSWYLVLRAGNNQEIARSVGYASKKEAEEVMAILLPGTKTAKKQVSTPAEKPPTPTKGKKKQEGKAPPKYNFRVELYPREEEAMAGIITNVVDGGNKKFRGVDKEAISSFILKQLSEEDKALLSEQKPKAKNNDRLVAQPAALDESKLTENLSIEIVENAASSAQRIWPQGKPFDIRLKYLGEKEPQGKVKISLLMYALEDRGTRSELVREINFTNSGNYHLSGFQKLSKTGIYRIKAISAASASEAAPGILFGTTAINVY